MFYLFLYLLCFSVTVAQLQRVLQEKDEQIQSLLKEGKHQTLTRQYFYKFKCWNPGENLSKRELKHTSIIKKLREKEKENEKIIEQQRAKLAEIDTLKNTLKDKDAQELKYDGQFFMDTFCINYLLSLLILYSICNFQRYIRLYKNIVLLNFIDN